MQDEEELRRAVIEGLDGLDAYVARYLPQLVLACLVPVAVLIRVAERGAHAELIEADGVYHRLWQAGHAAGRTGPILKGPS